MRAKLCIGAGLVVAVASVTLAMGAANASGGRHVHLVLPGRTQQVAFVDEDQNGSLNLGDFLETKGLLRDSLGGDRVGKAYGHCAVAARIAGSEGGIYRCNYLLHLEDGDIMVEGLDPHGEGSSAFAVMGGTGAYDGATGQARLTDSGNATHMDIDLKE